MQSDSDLQREARRLAHNARVNSHANWERLMQRDVDGFCNMVVDIMAGR